jgi:hypothetical protein
MKRSGREAFFLAASLALALRFISVTLQVWIGLLVFQGNIGQLATLLDTANSEFGVMVKQELLLLRHIGEGLQVQSSLRLHLKDYPSGEVVRRGECLRFLL